MPGLPERSVELAILQDQHLNERQKQSLLDVYASFLALHGPTEHATEAPTEISTEFSTEKE